MGRMQATASSLDQCIAEHERWTQQILPPGTGCGSDSGCSSQKAEKKADTRSELWTVYE